MSYTQLQSAIELCLELIQTHLRIRVQNQKIPVPNLKLRVLNSKLQVRNEDFPVPNDNFRVRNGKDRVQNPEVRVPNPAVQGGCCSGQPFLIQKDVRPYGHGPMEVTGAESAGRLVNVWLPIVTLTITGTLQECAAEDGNCTSI